MIQNRKIFLKDNKVCLPHPRRTQKNVETQIYQNEYKLYHFNINKIVLTHEYRISS